MTSPSLNICSTHLGIAASKPLFVVYACAYLSRQIYSFSSPLPSLTLNVVVAKREGILNVSLPQLALMTATASNLISLIVNFDVLFF
jgi:hypothetical protein